MTSLVHGLARCAWDLECLERLIQSLLRWLDKCTHIQETLTYNIEEHCIYYTISSGVWTQWLQYSHDLYVALRGVHGRWLAELEGLIQSLLRWLCSYAILTYSMKNTVYCNYLVTTVKQWKALVKCVQLNISKLWCGTCCNMHVFDFNQNCRFHNIWKMMLL